MRKGKRPADLNRLAASIVGAATDVEQEPETPQAAAGRRGGAKGGRMRAARLTAEQRSEIARRAAKARWASPKP